MSVIDAAVNYTGNFIAQHGRLSADLLAAVPGLIGFCIAINRLRNGGKQLVNGIAWRVLVVCVVVSLFLASFTLNCIISLAHARFVKIPNGYPFHIDDWAAPFVTAIIGSACTFIVVSVGHDSGALEDESL